MRTESPLPRTAGTCFVIPNFLSKDTCSRLIALTEERGYVSASSDYPPSYRNNYRQVVDSPELAAQLAVQLRSLAPAEMNAEGVRWRFDGVNERFRFCRYTAGQEFRIHQDGVHHRGQSCRSHLTFMIYLTDGEDFSGGDTVFYAEGPGDGAASQAPNEIGRVRPRAGTLILFDHAIWHAGELITGGTKHVLRSDVIYRRTDDGTADGIGQELTNHQGYVWTLAALENELVASGGRDCSIRLWNSEGKAIALLGGHDKSILGLAPLSSSRLASVSRDRSFRIWNLSTMACETTVRAHDAAVLDVARLQGDTLATSGADALIHLWKPDGRKTATLKGHNGWVWQSVPLGRERLASASEDGSVRVWDLAALRCQSVVTEGVPLRTLVIAGSAIWTGDVTGLVTCWVPSRDGWKPSQRLQAHRAAVRRLRLVAPGLVASCGEDCRMCIWRIDTGELVFEARHENFVTDVVAARGKLFSSSYDGQIRKHSPSLFNERRRA